MIFSIFRRSGFPSFVLPASKGAQVNPQPLGQFMLANPQGLTKEHDSFAEGNLSICERYVSKKLNDLGDKVKPWRRPPYLPTGYRVRVNAKALGLVFLQEAQVKALLPEMVSDGLQLPWIGWWEGP